MYISFSLCKWNWKQILFQKRYIFENSYRPLLSLVKQPPWFPVGGAIADQSAPATRGWLAMEAKDLLRIPIH